MRKPESLNNGPLADIAFLLLIFFLVTTTMNTEQGITTSLSPLNNSSQTDNARTMAIRLNSFNEIMVDDGVYTMAEFKRKILIDDFRSSNATTYILETDNEASYQSYVEVFDIVKQKISQDRNRKAMTRFGLPFKSLDANEKMEIEKHFPLKIQESFR